ncbi:MAG: hypothetical protein IT425_08980 [Pirellulales bacterium]|nr:hypothetical protein [Pirellulales bacterium]
MVSYAVVSCRWRQPTPQAADLSAAADGKPSAWDLRTWYAFLRWQC